MCEWLGLDRPTTLGLFPFAVMAVGGANRFCWLVAAPLPPPELNDTSNDGKDELDDELDIWDGDVRRSRELWGELGNESRSQ